ncbi:hypothetical protein [Vibrio mediterranei]|uniref:hypothetical protein n=1 Tax=Vibrio mediterranei TaxID=689 RepID=UPI00406815CE
MATTTLPHNVQQDLDSGFIMTDEDDGFQRCKRISETAFIYKCNTTSGIVESKIDTTEINASEAINGYYSNLEEVSELYGDDANMIIAECHFESNL